MGHYETLWRSCLCEYICQSPSTASVRACRAALCMRSRLFVSLRAPSKQWRTCFQSLNNYHAGTFQSSECKRSQRLVCCKQFLVASRTQLAKAPRIVDLVLIYICMHSFVTKWRNIVGVC